MLITLTYHLAYPEFREATKALALAKRRLQWRQIRWPRAIIFSIPLTIITVAVVSSAVFLLDNWIPNSWRIIPDPSDAIWIIAAVLIYPPLIYATLTYPRRLWKRSPHLTLPHTLTATDTHLTESWQSTTLQRAWPDVTSWLETPNTLIILLTPGHLIIPKHPPLQSTPENIEPLKSLLTLKTKTLQPTTAFPIEPDNPHPK